MHLLVHRTRKIAYSVMGCVSRRRGKHDLDSCLSDVLERLAHHPYGAVCGCSLRCRSQQHQQAILVRNVLDVQSGRRWDVTKASEVLGSARQDRAAAPVRFSCGEQSKASHSIARSLAEQGSRELVTSMPLHHDLHVQPSSRPVSAHRLHRVAIASSARVRSQVGSKHSWSCCATVLVLGRDRLSARFCMVKVGWRGTFGTSCRENRGPHAGCSAAAQQQRYRIILAVAIAKLSPSPYLLPQLKQSQGPIAIGSIHVQHLPLPESPRSVLKTRLVSACAKAVHDETTHKPTSNPHIAAVGI
jgi:hypothetical protein